MHYDALTTAAVAAEWSRLLLGGRIDRIFQPDVWSLALLARSQGQNWQVYASFNPRLARAHLVRERKLASGFDEPTAFVMLLRKHLEGARITGIHQPPLERILALEAAHSAAPPRRLIIELLGRQSNAILLDDEGVVLGALRLVTAEMSRTRLIMPRRPYAPPPPATGPGTDRLDPRSVTGGSLAAYLGADPAQPLAERLPRCLALSPTAAREAVFRATGSVATSAADPEVLAATVRDLCSPLADGNWSPSLATTASGVLAFAPYPLRHLEQQATVEALESPSLAVERYFGPREAAEGLEGRRSRLRGLLRAPLERTERRLLTLRRQQAEAQRDLALRTKGELLLAYQPEIAPGQRELTMDDYTTGQPVAVAVDPDLTAVQNAQRHFASYHRARRALTALEPLIAAAEQEAAFGRQALTDLALAESPSELARLEAELRETGFLGQPRRPAGRPNRKAPRKGERQPAPATATPASLQLDGFEVLYGKTSLTNDTLTFRVAGRQDLWLHAKGVPGSHVVIRGNGRPVPEHVLASAAGLAAYLSDARGEGKAAVDYTMVANVRRQPGGKPGLVNYVGERTLQVAPLSPDEVVATGEARRAG